MGRGCSCCNKDSRSCCPENVFLDDDSAIALYLIYEHTEEDKNISVEFETDLINRSVVLNYNVKNGTTYCFRFIFSKAVSIVVDKAPICNSQCQPPITFVDTFLNLNSFFDSDISKHKLFAWIDDSKVFGSLYCIKKYLGDPSYIYNSETFQNLCSPIEYVLEDNVYYNSANYNYDGDYWNVNLKYGCICACTDIYTNSLPDYEVDDNIGITFDDCGVVDGVNNSECDKIFYFTVSSRSTQTGIELVCTDRIEFNFFQAIHNIQCGDEEEYQVIEPLLFNQMYVPPIAKIVKPYSDTDVVIVTIDFSVEYIDCEGSLGCESCPEGSREKCFCFKDEYSLSANVFELRMTEPCVFQYDSIYTVNITRNYRVRNLSVNYSKFKLTISDIDINFNPLFWTEDCKNAYKDLIRSLEGSYEFSLSDDGCGNFLKIDENEIVAQSSFPCECFSGGGYFGNLNLDKYQHSESISMSTCHGLAPSGPFFSDGVIGASAVGDVGYMLRGSPDDESGCYWNIGLSTFPVYNSQITLFPNIGSSIRFDFAWMAFCNEVLAAINRKVSYCKGCEYTNKNIDISSIKYRYRDLFPLSSNFDCSLEGEFL